MAEAGLPGMAEPGDNAFRRAGAASNQLDGVCILLQYASLI